MNISVPLICSACGETLIRDGLNKLANEPRHHQVWMTRCVKCGAEVEGVEEDEHSPSDLRELELADG